MAAFAPFLRSNTARRKRNGYASRSRFADVSVRSRNRGSSSPVRPWFALSLLRRSDGRALGLPARGVRRTARLVTALREGAGGTLVMFGATAPRPGPALPPGPRLLLSDRQRIAQRRAGDGRPPAARRTSSCRSCRDRGPLRGRQLARRGRRREEIRVRVRSAADRAARVPGRRRRGPAARCCGRASRIATDRRSHGRLDTAISARRMANPFAQHPTPRTRRAAAALRAQFPSTRLPRRHAAHRSAAADQVAARDRDPPLQRPHQRRGDGASDQAAAPGKFEYELEAEATATGWSSTASRPPPTPPSSAPDRWAISGTTRTTAAR